MRCEAPTVAFEADFGQPALTGSIPLREEDPKADFKRLANCRIDTVLNAARVTVEPRMLGVARPIALQARIFRQTGTKAGDRRRRTVQRTGVVKRSDFTVMVTDQVRIVITARIIRQD